MKTCFVPLAALLVLMVVPFGLSGCGNSTANDVWCNDAGLCFHGDNDADGFYPDAGDTTGDGDNGGDQNICNEVNFNTQSVPPNLILMLDKSRSMDDPASQGSPTTKLEDLQTAVGYLLTQGDGKIRFGLLAFPGGNGCAPGNVSVPVSDTSVPDIRSRVNALTTTVGTPTGGALENADAYYSDLNDTVHRGFVLLVTDGMPTCPNGGGTRQNQADNQLALDAVTALSSHGFGTFVIGLGAETASNPQLLSDMAVQGGWPRAGDPKYYQANSVSELQAIFQTIGGMVIGCNLSLGSNRPEVPDYLWVYFDNVLVPRDRNHLNGWDYIDGSNQIAFYGTYCDQLKGGQVGKVDVKMGCSPPT
jgi:hypothetical protein